MLKINVLVVIVVVVAVDPVVDVCDCIKDGEGPTYNNIILLIITIVLSMKTYIPANMSGTSCVNFAPTAGSHSLTPPPPRGR